MGRWIALLLAALLAWLWLATDGFEHAPFGAEDDAGPGTPSDLHGADVPEAAPEAAGLRGRPAAAHPEEGEAELPSPVDLDAARERGDVHGRVVRRADGTPLAGATVQLVAYPWQRGGMLAPAQRHDAVPGEATRTASDGTFALPARVGVPVSLRVRADGFGEVERRGLVGGERVRIALDAAATLEVVTKAPDGTVLSDVHVTLRPADQGRSSLRREATSDAEGLCRFEGLPADRFALTARHGPLGGVAWVREGPRTKAGETLRHELVLPAGRVIRGRVRDAETKRPVAGARVGMDWAFFKTVTTDEEGRFALGGWQDELFDEIHVTADGYARGEAEVGQRTEVEIALVRGCGIRGRVLAPDGTAVADALLCVVGTQDVDGEAGGRLLSTTTGRTGADGRFALDDLHPSIPHRLVVMQPGFGRHLTEFDPPAPGRVLDLGTIVLPQALALRGVVVDAEDAPVPGIEVTLVGANDDATRRRAEDAPPLDHGYGRYEQARADEHGRFAFGELAPGTYSVQAGRRPHVAKTSVTLTADAVPPATVRLTLPEARVFTVRLKNPEGLPVREQYVGLELDGEEDLYQATDQEGTVTFRVPRAALRATVLAYYDALPGEPPYLRPEPAVVDLRDGSYVLRLLRAGGIRGRLLDPDGAPIPYAWVRALREGRVVGSQVTDAGGGFTVVTRPGPPVTLTFDGEVLPAGGAGPQVWTRRALEARLEAVVLDGEPVTLRATVAAADRTLRLRVVDEAGTAVAGVEVQVMPLPRSPPERVATAADGTAAIRGLTHHPIRVLLLPPEARRTTVAPVLLDDLIPPEEVHAVVLPRPVPFVVTVVDADDAPCPKASVTAYADLPLPSGKGTCDEEGRITLLLPPGLGTSLELRASWNDAEGEARDGMLERVDATTGAVRLRVR